MRKHIYFLIALFALLPLAMFTACGGGGDPGNNEEDPDNQGFTKVHVGAPPYIVAEIADESAYVFAPSGGFLGEGGTNLTHEAFDKIHTIILAAPAAPTVTITVNWATNAAPWSPVGMTLGDEEHEGTHPDGFFWDDEKKELHIVVSEVASDTYKAAGSAMGTGRRIIFVTWNAFPSTITDAWFLLPK